MAGEALGKLLAQNESTRLVLPYVAAGVTAVVALVMMGVLGAGALAGPWGLVAAAIIVVAVILVTVIIDGIVTAVKAGDWLHLQREVATLRNARKAKEAQELWRRGVEDAQISESQRLVFSRDQQPHLYYGHPGMPSPLTWWELRDGNAYDQLPDTVEVRTPEDKTQTLSLWWPHGGAERPADKGFLDWLAFDVQNIRDTGLTPFGSHELGLPGRVVRDGKVITDWKQADGHRDIRGAVYPRDWFPEPHRPAADEAAYDLRVKALRDFLVQLGSGHQWDAEYVGGYAVLAFHGLTPWLSDAAWRYAAGKRDQGPELPLWTEKSTAGALLAAPWPWQVIRPSPGLFACASPRRIGTADGRRYRAAAALSWQDFKHLFPAATEADRGAPFRSVIDPESGEALVTGVNTTSTANVHVYNHPAALWPVKLTPAEEAVEDALAAGAPTVTLRAYRFSIGADPDTGVIPAAAPAPAAVTAAAAAPEVVEKSTTQLAIVPTSPPPTTTVSTASQGFIGGGATNTTTNRR